MEYTFKVRATSTKTLYARSEKALEADVSTMCDELLWECPLDEMGLNKDYVIELLERDVKVTASNGDSWEESKFCVTFMYDFKCDIESTQLSNLISYNEHKEEELYDKVRALFAGSELAESDIDLAIKFNDEQNGLDSLLDGLYNRHYCFCIQHDGSLYHEECARHKFGDDKVDYVIEHGYNDDSMSSTTAHDFATQYENAFFHLEENCSTCECGESLFDNPAPFGDENCVEGSIAVRALPEAKRLIEGPR